MRILAVGNMYPPHHQGGYEIVWQAAMREARARGHEVRVLVSQHRESAAPAEQDPDVHRTLRWYWDWERHEFPQLGAAARIRLERANAAELRRHLSGFRPDVVSWWSMGSMSLSLIEAVRRAGLPALFAVHDDWLGYGFKADQWIRVWRGWRNVVAPIAERVIGIPTFVDIPAAGRLVFNSAYTRDHARALGVDVDGSIVVTPGVDERFLDAAPVAPWRWRLAYVGRLDRQKGVDTAVEALARLPAEATLVICGTGDEGYVDELREQARRLGVDGRVTFTGFASAETVRATYAEADAVVFPVRWDEPFGLVPLEAMGVGRPVVATARGGATEFLEDEVNVLEFPSDDAAALAEQIGRLAANPALRDRLRAGGTRTAAQHSMGVFAGRMVDELEAAAR